MAGDRRGKRASSASTRAGSTGGKLSLDSVEFGLDANNDLVLMDEVLTPDSSRYWPIEGYEAAFAAGKNPPSYDKQFLRDWLDSATVGGVRWDKTAPAPHLPNEVIENTAAKYQEALERLTR